MTTYGETSGRLYRDTDRAMLGGVCAGLAGHLGLNLKVTRVLAVIAFFMAMPFAVILYLAAVFLVPAESSRRSQPNAYVDTRCCWGMRRSRRADRRRKDHASRDERESPAESSKSAIKQVRQRYEVLDKRLAELEKEVTSPRFQLEQEFRKL